MTTTLKKFDKMFAIFLDRHLSKDGPISLTASAKLAGQSQPYHKRALLVFKHLGLRRGLAPPAKEALELDPRMPPPTLEKHRALVPVVQELRTQTYMELPDFDVFRVLSDIFTRLAERPDDPHPIRDVKRIQSEYSPRAQLSWSVTGN